VLSVSFGLGEHAMLVFRIAMILPLLVMVVKALQIHFHTYELTSEVFRERVGLLNRQIHELELYRVRDTTTLKPFHLNICGLGHIRIDTSDFSTPIVGVLAVKQPDKVRQLLREQVENMRMQRGILEVSNQ
jgi:uncharacterized membrane protein YdbT with pleckstrin-like domain